MVAVPLLRTKLFIPPLRAEWVARPRLTQRLVEAARRPLTLISAPAGFGKTTLLADWVAQGGQGVAWVSLDEGDNDPVRFWAYVIAALQTTQTDLDTSILGLLESPQPPPIQSVLTVLLNELAGLDNALTLILDDYHLIETQTIHEGLAFLLDHLPPQLRLIITCRADPFLPLARLRARGQLSELRAADLRFTTDEAAAFLNEVMGLSLSATDVAALEEHTEGWVAGLQLAALSMQGRQDVASFIEAFTGSHRFILDYLTDEVLGQRPQGTENFLLQTSILDRLCGPLCDALTGGNDGQATLERLEQANLFIVPLDDERHWYRYHHLFAEVLRNRLHQAASLPDEELAGVAELHGRASAWFDQAGLIDEAIRYALAAPDFERAAALIEWYSVVMLQQGKFFVIRTWLQSLPTELVQTRPRLIVAYGWILLLTSPGQAIDQWLATPQVSAALTRPDLPSPISGEVALLKATISRFRRENVRSLELAQEALTCLADDERGLAALAMYTIGVAQRRQGNIAAKQTFIETVQLGEATGGPHTALAGLQELSDLQVRQGQLSQVMQTCQQALRMITRQGWESMPAAGMVQSYIGQVLYEWNDLAGATQALLEGIELLRGSIEQYILVQEYVTLARVRQAEGDLAGALDVIQRCEDWFAQMQVGDLGSGDWLSMGQARLWLAQGQLTVAADWARTGKWQAEETHLGCLQRLTLVRLSLAQNRHNPDEQFLQEASKILNQLLILSESGGWGGQLIEILLLQALVAQAQGDSAEALVRLERALALAELEGYVRSFVDEGQPMAELLRQAQSCSIKPEYVSKLLAAFGPVEQKDERAAMLPPPSPRSPASPLIESLTERELELLGLVAVGHSNQEIAQALTLAIGTVKKHLNNIFGKLGVSNRTQAVARARELDLL